METIGRLATSVIHDLNNLLTLVQLNAALLEQGGVSESEVRDIAERIGQACNRSSDLTRKVLDLARRKDRVRRPFDVGSLVRKHTDLLETFVANRADLSVKIHGGDLWSMGDPGEIEQAVLNLILNAADSMEGRGRVQVECRGVEGEGLGSVEITVSDDGSGIPADIRERIFDPLFTTKAVGVGTGMGLFTVRQVVERHGGVIEVDSVVGRGSRFTVRLPRVSGESEIDVTSAVGQAEAGGRQLLLLVEDDPGIRELTRRILIGSGLRVVDAGDGETALAVWERHRAEIKLLLTDIVLPGELSGRDVAVRVQQDEVDLPVIYISGFSDAGDDFPYLTAGNFLRKPFSPMDLKRIVDGALSRPLKAG